jgi:hypothetical protein
MKHVLVFIAPMQEGEHAGQHPTKGDQRFENLRVVLRDYGLLHPSTGKVWREFMFYRGYYAGTPQTPLGWFSWRMEWDDAEPQRETAAIPDPC